ncbi:MAG: GGDEF domain-containing protein [Polyangiales bacterium]
MLTPQVIAALTEAARAANAHDTSRALSSVRELLGDKAAVCEPLLHALARRGSELQRLRELARRDPLTGAGNRRTFEEELARESARHRRTHEPFAVILLDLDDLKARNDGFGHAAGDQALVALTQACQQTVRETDLVARLGGDEFAVLLPGSNHAGASALAARLRARIEQAEAEGGGLRVSLGVAAAEHGRLEVDLVTTIADRDLYRDKAQRKQRSANEFAA